MKKTQTICSFSGIKMALAAVLFFLTFMACKKEALPPVTATQSFNTSGTTAKAVTGVTYSSCGMKVNVFTPFENAAKLYSFAYTVNGQQKKFAIGSAGTMNFNSYDKFSFEFAGYLDKAGKVKSWKIRRTDGKYLTTGLTYANKLIGSAEAEQIFLLSSLGNSQYKILLPKLSVCNLAAVWDDVDLGYRIANFDYDDFRLESKDTKVAMLVIPLSNH